MSTSDANAELDAQVLAFDATLGERMIDAVYRFLGRFVSYPSEHARIAHALWIVHSHMMDAWDSTPRFSFLSAEPASGKTRALEITELLVPNPVATVNVTPAYLFRKVGDPEGATILFDEVDTVFGPRAKDNEDIRGLLNAGHRRGATTGRCLVRGHEVILQDLPAYAAVALAGIGWLPDTILSRSVIIRMRRRHAGEPIEAFRRRIHEPEGRHVRDLIELWAGSVSPDVNGVELPDSISDRDADVWEPLIAVADAIGGDWPRRAREAGIALVSERKEVEPSLGIRLLSDLKVIFGDAEQMASKAILQALHGIEEAPWSDLRGKPLDERGLGHRLRQYGVKSKTIRIGTTTPKGYMRTDLVDVWTRYLPPSPAASATSATSATSFRNGGQDSPQEAGSREIQRSHESDVSDVADVAPTGGDGRACLHCHKGHGPFCEVSIGGETYWLHLDCKDKYRP